jgi:hypothetical protein
VLYNPLYAVIAYFAVGAVVLGSRLLFPKAKTEATVEDAVNASAANEQRELAKAA